MNDLKKALSLLLLALIVLSVSACSSNVEEGGPSQLETYFTSIDDLTTAAKTIVEVTQHLWEHYAFSGDEAYLRHTAYPIMKEAALFCLDWLFEDQDGYLITSPSTSPEHKFRAGDKHQAVSAATTMDLSLIGELFDNCIKAAEWLKVDEDFAKTLAERKQKLLPLQIGKYGRL